MVRIIMIMVTSTVTIMVTSTVNDDADEKESIR